MVGKLEDSSLIAKYLGPASQLLCASPEYLAQRGEPRAVAELERHRVLAYEGIRDLTVWGFLGPKGETSISLNPDMSSNDFAVLLEFSPSGLGIAQLPSFVAADARGGVRSRKPCKIIGRQKWERLRSTRPAGTCRRKSDPSWKSS